MEPVWLHLMPIAEEGASEQPHQPSRQCWCGPAYAIDVRSTLARDDVRVLLHRGGRDGQAKHDEFFALRSRKGEFVSIP